MRSKLSLGQRLFATALACFALVAGVGLELVRWQFLDNFSEAPRAPRDPRLLALADAIQARYALRHDWSFLPADPAVRTAWLHAQAGAAAAGAPAFAERLALEDADRRVLAGAVASRWLMALTSIDTISEPLRVEGALIGHLALAQAQRPDDDLAVAFLITRQRRLGLAVLAGVLACVIASAWLAANFRKPVRQLVDASRRLEAGQFDARLPATRSDELGELARTFNRLAATLGDTERARRQWMADTSHELRTPLAVLRGQLEALQDGVRSPTPENVAAMLAQVLGLARLVDDLQALTPPPLVIRRIDAWAVLLETAQAFGERLRGADLRSTIAAQPACSSVAGDADRLRQVFANLLENSLRHTDAGGRVELAASVAGDSLVITLDDTAPGVPEAALARLGERFFRVDASRSRRSGGSGLGLAVSRRIVEAHGGHLAFGASPLGGLRAIVTLPLDD